MKVKASCIPHWIHDSKTFVVWQMQPQLCCDWKKSIAVSCLLDMHEPGLKLVSTSIWRIELVSLHTLLKTCRSTTSFSSGVSRSLMSVSQSPCVVLNFISALIKSQNINSSVSVYRSVIKTVENADVPIHFDQTVTHGWGLF